MAGNDDAARHGEATTATHRRNASVSLAGPVASRRRRVSVAREVRINIFGGGKRVAARDASTSAGGDASVPLRNITLGICTGNSSVDGVRPLLFASRLAPD
jgi:hypothetical protein